MKKNILVISLLLINLLTIDSTHAQVKKSTQQKALISFKIMSGLAASGLTFLAFMAAQRHCEQQPLGYGIAVRERIIGVLSGILGIVSFASAYNDIQNYHE